MQQGRTSSTAQIAVFFILQLLTYEIENKDVTCKCYQGHILRMNAALGEREGWQNAFETSNGDVMLLSNNEGLFRSEGEWD